MLMNKILSYILLFIFAINSYADGKLYSINSIYENYAVQMEQGGQNAVIDYQNGIEELYISINANIEKSEEMLWIFPVKANEKDVKIEILDCFPKLEGKRLINIDGKFKKEILLNLVLSEHLLNLSINIFAVASAYKNSKSRIKDEKYFFDFKEKYGLKLYYGSVKDENGFRNLVSNTGKNIPADEEICFRDYFSDQYTILVVHVKDIREFRQKFSKKIFTPAVKIDFPSKNIYYPMKATMSYLKNFRIDVYILGGAELLNDNINSQIFTYILQKIDGYKNKIKHEYFTLFSIREWNENSEAQDIFFKKADSEKLKKRNILTHISSSSGFKFLFNYIIVVSLNFLIFILTLTINKKNFKKYWKKGFSVLLGVIFVMYQFEKIEKTEKSGFRMMMTRKKMFILIFLIGILFSMILPIYENPYKFHYSMFYESIVMFIIIYFFIFIIYFQIVKFEFIFRNRLYLTFQLARIIFYVLLFITFEKFNFF